MNKKQFLKYCEMQAAWWIASATTGHTLKRKISVGIEGGGMRDLTDQEKIDDAVATAQTHIHRYLEAAEGKDF